MLSTLKKKKTSRVGDASIDGLAFHSVPLVTAASKASKASKSLLPIP
jgi:hypothetical protein